MVTIHNVIFYGDLVNLLWNTWNLPSFVVNMVSYRQWN